MRGLTLLLVALSVALVLADQAVILQRHKCRPAVLEACKVPESKEDAAEEAYLKCVDDSRPKLEAICGEELDCVAESNKQCNGVADLSKCFTEHHDDLEGICPYFNCEVYSMSNCPGLDEACLTKIKATPEYQQACSEKNEEEVDSDKDVQDDEKLGDAEAALMEADYVLTLLRDCKQLFTEECKGKTSAEDVKKCIIDNAEKFETTCGKAKECLTTEVDVCLSSITTGTISAHADCLQNNKDQLHKQCPSGLQCEVEVGRLCGDVESGDKTKECIREHKSIEERCTLSSEHSESFSTTDVVTSVVSSHVTCFDELTSSCGSAEGAALLECLDKHKTQFETVCGKSVNCLKAQHQHCGKADVHGFAKCIGENNGNLVLSAACPLIDCEAAVARSCPLVYDTKNDLVEKCVSEHKEELGKVCTEIPGLFGMGGELDGEDGVEADADIGDGGDDEHLEPMEGMDDMPLDDLDGGDVDDFSEGTEEEMPEGLDINMHDLDMGEGNPPTKKNVKDEL
eukprot:CAMPEP_0114553016 /NCGR_PEP_ID=MMETSP0114-20121206/7431_1 /TAXON_ID=31324 /ORGANISM="Goniomonas sp, Strain m" /LENGTH=512 /DNA_ID=CAMNT_0001737927 /DNA_START=6 /DNA_END=1544 /DNA_ORIENTATION=+